MGVQYSGKIRFIEPQGINGHRRPVPGAPSSGTSRESQAMFRDAKSSIPALSYFQIGMKHEQELCANVSYMLELYAKGALCGSQYVL